MTLFIYALSLFTSHTQTFTFFGCVFVYSKLIDAIILYIKLNHSVIFETMTDMTTVECWFLVSYILLRAQTQGEAAHIENSPIFLISLHPTHHHCHKIVDCQNQRISVWKFTFEFASFSKGAQVSYIMKSLNWKVA